MYVTTYIVSFNPHHEMLCGSTWQAADVLINIGFSAGG